MSDRELVQLRRRLRWGLAAAILLNLATPWLILATDSTPYLAPANITAAIVGGVAWLMLRAAGRRDAP